MDAILPFVLVPTYLILALLIFTALGLLQIWSAKLQYTVITVLGFGLILTWLVTTCMFFPHLFPPPSPTYDAAGFALLQRILVELGRAFLLSFLLVAPPFGAHIAPWLAKRGFILAPATQLPTASGDSSSGVHGS